MTYHEYRFWSPVLGCDAVRFFMMDSHGGEHFAIVPLNRSGRDNRAARMAALASIEEHIKAGADPGEVEVTYAG